MENVFMICISCNVEFDSVQEYVSHERGGHKSRPQKELPPSPPLTPSATELKALEEKLADPKNVPIEYESIKITPPKQEPLELKYVWTGVHAVCNSSPKTIMLHVGESEFAVAFCINCDKELEKREVIPLEKQFPIPIRKKK